MIHENLINITEFNIYMSKLSEQQLEVYWT